MKKDFGCQEDFGHKIWSAVSVVISQEKSSTFPDAADLCVTMKLAREVVCFVSLQMFSSCHSSKLRITYRKRVKRWT